MTLCEFLPTQWYWCYFFCPIKFSVIVAFSTNHTIFHNRFQNRTTLLWGVGNLTINNSEMYIREIRENLLSTKSIKPNNTHFRVSIHGKCFAWTCLSIGKTCYFCSLKCWINERSNSTFINLTNLMMNTSSLLVP